MVQVSAGYDAHRLDPLEHLNYQSATYHVLVSSLMRLADELCSKSLCLANLHLQNCMWFHPLPCQSEPCRKSIAKNMQGHKPLVPSP